MATRPLTLQWIQGNADVAETSFFKINTQGTPLDDIEEMLIRNRRKPIAIGARAILRSGSGHKYWSAFTEAHRTEIENLAAKVYELLFEPESTIPLKTLEVSLGGTVSPVDALSLLVDFLTIAGSNTAEPISIESYADDLTGEATCALFRRSIKVIEQLTGNSPASLGLHPAVYFYNERGKYSRFLFLGMTYLVSEKIKNNNREFFKLFTSARARVETFILDNKLNIGLLLQNMSKKQRVPGMKKMFEFLVSSFNKADGVDIGFEEIIGVLGFSGRILDIKSKFSSTRFDDDTKSMLFLQKALKSAAKCSICGGYLDPMKSVHYDHVVRVREGGVGSVENGDLVHPFCDSGIKA